MGNWNRDEVKRLNEELERRGALLVKRVVEVSGGKHSEGAVR